MKYQLKDWLIVPIMIFIWVFALVYASGIGVAYDVYGKVKFLVIVIFCLTFGSRFWEIQKEKLFVSSFIIIHGVLTNLIYGYDVFDYVWMYLLVILISLFPVKVNALKMIAAIYGVLGVAVLYIYNYGSLFSGWNTNSIAMIVFFSFAVLLVAFNGIHNWKMLGFIILCFIAYYQWSGVLNSRSGVFFTIVMLLGILEILPFRRWLRDEKKLLFLLCVPLIIAIVLVMIRNTAFVPRLNQWSLETFQKPIFNGRDELWYQGFQYWKLHPIFGTGNLSAANWHNSAVTMLVGGGVSGFLFLIFGIKKILETGKYYLDDQIVYGLMVAFLSIWLQQSVELGVVAGKVNAIPYALLGLLIGRVKTLKMQRIQRRGR